MENRSHTQGGISFWGNVRKLVQIYFLQRWKLMLYSILIVAFWVLLITFVEIRNLLHTENMQGQFIIDGSGGMIYVVGMAVFLFTSYNALGNDRISMFPGNALSRYIARLLVDYSLFLGYVLLVGLLYLLQSALFWLFLHGNTGIDLRFLFDVRYLGLGILHMYLLWMMCHGILTFLLAIHAKWGNKVMAVLFALFFLLFYDLFFFHHKVIAQIFGWWSANVMENKDFFSYMGFALVIWLTGMFLSFLLVSRMRKWPSNNDVAVAWIVTWMGAFCWFMIIGLLLTESGITGQDAETHDFYETTTIEDADSFPLEYRGKLKTILWNDFFSDVDRFLYSDREESYGKYFDYGTYQQEIWETFGGE